MERGGRRKRWLCGSCFEGKAYLQRLTDHLHQTQNTRVWLPRPIWMASKLLTSPGSVSVPSSSQIQTSCKNIHKVQEDPGLGRLLLQCENGQVQPAGDREDRRPHQWHVQRLLQTQLVPPGEHIRQHRPALQSCWMGGFGSGGSGHWRQKHSPGSRSVIPVPEPTSVHQLNPCGPAEAAAAGCGDGDRTQLQNRIPENQPVQEDEALHVRPGSDLLLRKHPVPGSLDLCQTLQGYMHLHRLHRHRLQAGAESLSGPQLPDGAEPAALWMTGSETLKLRCETLTFQNHAFSLSLWLSFFYMLLQTYNFQHVIECSLSPYACVNVLTAKKKPLGLKKWSQCGGAKNCNSSNGHLRLAPEDPMVKHPTLQHK